MHMGNEIHVQQMSCGGADVSVHQLSSSSLGPSPSDDDMEGEEQTIGTMNISAEKVNKR